MTPYEKIAVFFSALSFILGVITVRKSNKANDTAEKANELSKKSEKIAQGQIELYINQLISQTKKDVIDLTIKVAESCSGSDGEKKKKELLNKALNSAIEINLNAYDEACAKYIDMKVDRDRFKKNYMVAIRQEVESDVNRERFNATTSPYKAILKVYKEWNDMEN